MRTRPVPSRALSDHACREKPIDLGLPVKFGRTPGAIRCPAPTLGQHTREVLGENDYGEAEIDGFIAAGVAG